MKPIFFAALVLLLPAMGSAQLGSVLKRLKNTAASTAETKVNTTTSDAVNKGIDKVFGRKEKKSSGTEARTDLNNKPETESASPSAADPLVAYSRFDFVPGENVIYAEDFSGDNIGEFPLQWTTKTKGEVVTLNRQEGNWLKGYKKSQFTSVNKNELGDDYTIECDLIYYFGAKAASYVMPNLFIRVLNNYTVDYTHASGNVSERDGEQSFQLSIHPKDDESLAWVETYGMPGNFESEKVGLPQFSRQYNQPLHYAMQVQKGRVRIWLNEKKIFDLPQVITADKKMARIAFGIGDASYEEGEVGFCVSNIRLANGISDSRHKLLEKGTFSTSGILFTVNSAGIKPESSGIIREIGKVLSENPSVRIRITGHTSSDGTATGNSKLSEQRAEAVKNFLVKECKIEASRLETAGAGDTKPIASNSTPEGKAQNRRVEFTKL